MNDRTQKWGLPVQQATFDLIEGLKGARFSPDQGADVLSDVFASIVAQIDVGFPAMGFRKQVIAKLAAMEPSNGVWTP